jgi:hypothetical protein
MLLDLMFDIQTVPLVYSFEDGHIGYRLTSVFSTFSLFRCIILIYAMVTFQLYSTCYF